MNKEEPYRDQAERLKQRIEKINEDTDDHEDHSHMPPREQLHRNKKKKTKFKLKYPVIRLLVLFFILLPVIIFSAISYLEGKKITGTEKTSVDSVETINLEKTKIEEKNTPDKPEKQRVTKQENPAEKSGESAVEDQPPENVADPTVQSSGSSGENPTEQAAATNESSVQTQTQTQTVAKSEPASAPETKKIVYHTVQPKETIYRIAMKYYHSKAGIDIIKKANNLKNDQITTGQILKIPLNN